MSNVRRHEMQADPLTWWQSELGSIAPVGHALRRYLHANWTRFHSLPESKRYPESKDEVTELLRRHTQVASELFAPGEPVYVFQSRYPESRRQLKAKHSVAGRQLRETSALFPVSPGTVGRKDDDILTTRALETTWKPDFFDRLVEEVANEQEVLVALAAPSSKNVYCPYDGGMDIFAFSLAPSQLENKFSSWLSDRPDKL
jgi:hypothetical protein